MKSFNRSKILNYRTDPSCDPMGENGGENLYALVANSPMDRCDIDGRGWWTTWGPRIAQTSYDNISLPTMRYNIHEVKMSCNLSSGSAMNVGGGDYWQMTCTYTCTETSDVIIEYNASSSKKEGDSGTIQYTSDFIKSCAEPECDQSLPDAGYIYTKTIFGDDGRMA